MKPADTEGRSLYAGFSGDFSYEVDINSILFSRRRNSKTQSCKARAPKSRSPLGGQPLTGGSPGPSTQPGT